MIKYVLNEDGSVDDRVTGACGIRPGVWMWEQYQEWLAGGNTPVPVKPGEHYELTGDTWVLNKEKKLEQDLAAIDAQVQQADKQPFTFDGHTFYPDTEFIHGMFSMLPYLPDNYTENWKTAEKQPDGISNVYVTLDKTALAGLASAYFQFKKNNWAAGEVLKQQLKDDFLGE